jgi:hypothetical protein
MKEVGTMSNLEDQLYRTAENPVVSALYDYGVAVYDATRPYRSDYDRHDAGLFAVSAGTLLILTAVHEVASAYAPTSAQYVERMWRASTEDATRTRQPSIDPGELFAVVAERFEREFAA